MSKSYYEILGVQTKATTEEISKAYATRLKTFRAALESKQPINDEDIRLLREAYKTLTDKTERMHYDKSLSQQLPSVNNLAKQEFVDTPATQAPRRSFLPRMFWGEEKAWKAVLLLAVVCLFVWNLNNFISLKGYGGKYGPYIRLGLIFQFAIVTGCMWGVWCCAYNQRFRWVGSAIRGLAIVLFGFVILLGVLFQTHFSEMFIAAEKDALAEMQEFYRQKSPEATLCLQYGTLFSQAYDFLQTDNKKKEVEVFKNLVRKLPVEVVSAENRSAHLTTLLGISLMAIGLQELGKEESVIAFLQLCRVRSTNTWTSFLEDDTRLDRALRCQKEKSELLARKRCTAQVFSENTSGDIDLSWAIDKPPIPQATQPIPEYEKLRLPIIDSGFPVAEYENLWWLDNDRVMFKGYEVGTYDAETEKSSYVEGRKHGMKVGFFIWDTRENTFTLYGRNIYNFCYEDGQALYWKLKPEGPPAGAFRGPLHQEKELPGAQIQDYGYNLGLTRYPCGVKREPNTLFPLRPSWGALKTKPADEETAKNDKAYSLLLFPPKGSPVELPMRYRERGQWGSVLYAPWREQYLMIESYNNNDGVMPAAWWLSQGGRTESVNIPNTGYVSARFYPVRPGVLMVGRWRPGDKYADGHESYLLGNDGRVVSLGTDQFVLGSPESTKYGISPNGCRIAYRDSRCKKDPNNTVDKTIPNRGEAPNKGCFTVHLIDFCTSSNPTGEHP